MHVCVALSVAFALYACVLEMPLALGPKGQTMSGRLVGEVVLALS